MVIRGFERGEEKEILLLQGSLVLPLFLSFFLSFFRVLFLSCSLSFWNRIFFAMGDGQAYSSQANYTILSLCIIIVLLMYHSYFDSLRSNDHILSSVSKETLQQLVHAEIQSLMANKVAAIEK